MSVEYQPFGARFNGFGVYLRYIIVATAAILIATGLWGPSLAARGIKSWWTGATSGLPLAAFVFSAAIFLFSDGTVWHCLLFDLGAILVFFVVASCLYFRAQTRGGFVEREEDVYLSEAELDCVGTREVESDDPIRSWSQDALERAPLINAISFSLLMGKVPVLALLGEFGSGKTSIFNLLRDHLQHKAIVVSFSTWLPGSSETLSTYLLGDIARECGRHYVAPGLRRDARKIAAALAKSVPVLNDFSEMLSSSTQWQDVQSLADAISRLPKRVIVLLDEVDRMQRKEILALLKIVRGVSTSPNLSFVFAFDRRTVERAVCKAFDSDSNVYFEKFFPVTVRVPVADGEVLRNIGIHRLVGTLRRRRWFEIDLDESEFIKQIEKIWNELIAPFCQTPRAVGLLANDVGVAASSLKGEINPVDLTLIELLRRFEVSVYEIVWRYRDILTGGEDLLSPSFRYQSDHEKGRRKRQLVVELDKAVEDPDRLETIRTMLDYMFPLYSKIDERRLRSVPARWRKEDVHDQKICDPSLIAAYFRYKLPQDLFSSRELTAFLRKFEEAPDAKKKEREFLTLFESMAKGDPRRDNFLEKLSDRVPKMGQATATSLVPICMKAAHAYVYDLGFVGVAEAGHVLRILMDGTSRPGRRSGKAALTVHRECHR